jgi:aconitate hydratase
MGNSLTYKILAAHSAEKPVVGQEITLDVDQSFIHDLSGSMAGLSFMAMGIEKVKPPLSVAYMDHNLLQNGFENSDDHRFIFGICQNYGLLYFKPGSGICHQNHIERFAKPGETLVASDSHTQTSGALGMLAIGAGGQDVAVTMATGKYTVVCPDVINIRLEGQLRPWVTAKDIGLEILRRGGVRGGYGKVFEFTGDGVSSLSVYERATIANMGTEAGATSSVFPTDERTRQFLRMHGREKDFSLLVPDDDATYSETWDIDLSSLEPLVACPHSPGNVKRVSELAGLKVDQVIVGSCTNSSYNDLMITASILSGSSVNARVDMSISPGSRRVLEVLVNNNALSDMISAGARILELGCGPCAGNGQSPASGAISLRTMNRNFRGRCGTDDAEVYLVSPETAAVSALRGVLTDPRELGEPMKFDEPEQFPLAESCIVWPDPALRGMEPVRGPNIKELKLNEPIADAMIGKVLIKLGDNVSTDDISPSGAKVFALRSNVEAIAEYVFEKVYPGFPDKCREFGGGFIVGGKNYGQGSSREHAALAPMALGVKAVFAQSFARIHWSNLINWGVVPITITSAQYDLLQEDMDVEVTDVWNSLTAGGNFVVKIGSEVINCDNRLSERERAILLEGGLLQFTRKQI